MGGHLALTRLTHAIAFFGVRQNNCGLSMVSRGRRISGVDFDQIMTTAF